MLIARDSLLLDCSCLPEAVASLAALFAMSESDLRESLTALEVDWHGEVSPERQVLRALGCVSGKVPSPTGIRWFHSTRVLPGTTFGEGILPTTVRMPNLWDALWQFAGQWISEGEWNRYKLDFAVADRHFAAQFRRKSEFLRGCRWAGPFAFLVRDAAVGSVGNHIDFTAMPECLADICADFNEVYDKPLRLAFQRGTRPCLVTFTTPGDYPGAVQAAASYVYRSLRSLGHDTGANANYDGAGTPIPASWIDEIHWLDDRHRTRQAE